MIYIGMDISSKSFVVHAVDGKKRRIFKGEILPSRAGIKNLIKELGSHRKLVVFEAGNQLKWVAQTLKKLEGVDIHVVHPNEIKWINQSSGKTDKIDARKLAELARADMLPRKVHIVEGTARQLRELVSARQTLQSKRIALVNSIRGMMKQEGYKLPKGFFQDPEWTDRVKRLKIGQAGKAIITSYMNSIESLAASEQELTAQILEIEDKDVELLKSIPAIGEITSRVIKGAIDNAERFDSKRAVSKYGALTPRIYQSGDVIHHGRINRNGRLEVRRVLLQCAHTITRMKSYEARPLREFFERIKRRRGKKKAVVALARKLLTVAYGVLKSQSVYNPALLVAKAV